MMNSKSLLPAMKPNVNDGIGPGLSQGYTFSYRCGDYVTTVAFDDRDCGSVISNVANFLLGCGFSPNNVIECMADTSENLDSAWRVRSTEIDPEIARKWDLFESSQVV